MKIKIEKQIVDKTGGRKDLERRIDLSKLKETICDTLKECAIIDLLDEYKKYLRGTQGEVLIDCIRNYISGNPFVCGGFEKFALKNDELVKSDDFYETDVDLYIACDTNYAKIVENNETIFLIDIPDSKEVESMVGEKICVLYDTKNVCDLCIKVIDIATDKKHPFPALLILQLLKDNPNGLSQNEIITQFSNKGYTITRQTVGRIISDLKNAGYEIEKNNVLKVYDSSKKVGEIAKTVYPVLVKSILDEDRNAKSKEIVEKVKARHGVTINEKTVKNYQKIFETMLKS